MQNTKANDWTKFVSELQECVSGKRGWVSASKKRALKMGIAHSNLIVAAKALGLVVDTHGHYGYCATRKK